MQRRRFRTSARPRTIVPPAPTYDFQDEFTGSSLDGSKWVRENLGYGYGSLETFTADTDLATVSGGQLVMKAIKDQSGARPWRAPYISTRGKFTMRTGTVEFRCTQPTAQGAWTAPIWLHNSAFGENGSARAELDLSELFPGGGVSGPGTYSTLHDWSHSPQVATNNTPSTVVQDGLPHTYKATWDATKFESWIDGVSQGIITAAAFNAAGGDFSVFSTTDMYLISDLAVGTSWGGPEPLAGTTALQFSIDYIRVTKTS